MNNEYIRKGTASNAIASLCWSLDRSKRIDEGTGAGMAKEVIDNMSGNEIWTRCSDELPSVHGKEYLVTINDGGLYVTTAQWDMVHKQWYFSYYDKAVGERFKILTDDVVAWAESPKPFKTGD